jgi:hypothetical protein
VDVTEEAFRDGLRTIHMPDWQADGLVEHFAHYRRGEAAEISSAAKDVTGPAPRPFSVFARDHEAAFLQPKAPAALQG